MTQEDKELLFKDLCARLPYNVICQVEFKENGKYNSKVMLLSGIFTDKAYFTTKGGSIYSNEYKPYFFPMLSMTEEQKKEYNLLRNRVDKELYDTWKSIDYLNTHHFDYRGLIEKGLAIDATGLNIYWVMTIKIEDGIDDLTAISVVKKVIEQGKISDDGNSYCYLTFFDNIVVETRQYRKSPCFRVCKK